MTLPHTANALVDIYRGFSAASPYPSVGTPPAGAAIAGHLKHHVRNGRHGQGLHLKWTHLLLLPPGTDIRSAYHSQLNTWQPENADTVVLPDYPIPGWCTAFLVVMVQRAGRGTATEHLRAYLDRLRPREGGCLVAGCCPGLPATLHATIPGPSGCPCLDGEDVELTYDQGSQRWIGEKVVCSSELLHVEFACPGSTCGDARLTVDFENHGSVGPVSPDGGCSCSPPSFEFIGLEFPTLGSECDGAIDILVTT